MEKILNFTVIPLRMTYPKQALKLSFDPFDEDEELEDEIDSFKIYACESPDGYVKKSTYGSISILGNLPDLSIGVEHKVKAIEEYKNGNFQYKILNIKRDKPIGDSSVRLFLSEFCTSRQVEELMREYPNIINMVINNEADNINTSKLHGIGDYIINVIKRKILENFVYAELVDTFKGFLDFKTVKALYKLYPSVEQVKAHIALEPYKTLCKLSRVGFKTADKMLLEFDKKCRKMHESGEEPPILFDFELITSYQRMESCVSFILAQNEQDGNTKMKKSQLQRESKNLASQCMSHFGDVLKTSNEFVVVEEWVAIKDTYDAEKYIAEKLTAIKNSQEKKWKYDISNINNGKEFPLTDEQMSFINNVLASNVTLLPSAGGTGKTFCLNELVQIIKTLEKSFLLLAPTGKASKRMSEYTNESAYTIHRGLGFTPEGFTYNENCNLPHDIVILDESSMVDIFIFQSLLRAINPETTKLVMIGDISQIPSVSCGRVFNDIIDTELFNTNVLTVIFRYGEGGLYKVATNVRNGKSYFGELKDKITPFGTNKDYVLIRSSQENSVQSIVSVYGQLIKKGIDYSDIVITMAMNKGDYGSIVVNETVQKWILNNTTYLDSCQSIKHGDTTYYAGSLIMQTKNDYRIKDINGDISPVFNGSMGKVISVDGNKMEVIFDGIRYYYNRGNLENVQLCYCCNIFKMQGSQAPYIILNTPKAHTYMMNKDLLYTAISRTQKRCFHITDTAIIEGSLKKSASRDRMTFLKELILGGCNGV